jgi:hypothetical protein
VQLQRQGPFRRPIVRASATAVLGWVVALTLGACSASPSPNGASARSHSGSGSDNGTTPAGTPVVTPATARGIVGPTMATNNRANAALSSSLLASYEAGSAFVLDNSTYAADRAAKYHPSYTPFTVALRAVGVTRQSGWPAHFVALGTQHTLGKRGPVGPSCGTALWFEKSAPSAKWHIVLEPSLDAKQIPQPATTNGGYEQSVAAARVRLADAVPAEVVKALFALETSGRLGPFRRSDFTGQCWQMPNPRLDVLNAESAGFSQRDLFTKAARPDTAALALTGGGTLVMFTLGFEDQLVSTLSSNPIDWTHPSLSKNPGAAWMYFLSSGTYSEIVERGELEVAVELSPSGRSWSVVGAYSGVTSVTGHRVKATPAPPSGTMLSAFVRR